jgi:acetoacetate decarboxylase
LFGIAYRETAILLPVHRWWLQGVFCPWILVDNDAMLIQGRELLGFPKKIGKLSLSLRDAKPGAAVEASAERGSRLVHMRGRLLERDPQPLPFLGGRRFLNVWGALGPTIPKLISFKTEEMLLEAWKAEASLELHGTATDRLDELKAGKVLSARFYRAHIRVGSKLPLPVGIVSPRFLLRHFPLRYL